jgi:hypothetical protein
MRAGDAGSGRNEGRSPTYNLSSQHRVSGINAEISESPAKPGRNFPLFDPQAGRGISRSVLWRAGILGHDGQFTLVDRCSKPQKTYHFFPFPKTFFSGMKPLSGWPPRAACRLGETRSRLTPPLAEVEKHRLVSRNRSTTAFSRRCSLNSADVKVAPSSSASLANVNHQRSNSRSDNYVCERYHEGLQPVHAATARRAMAR